MLANFLHFAKMFKVQVSVGAILKRTLVVGSSIQYLFVSMYSIYLLKNCRFSLHFLLPEICVGILLCIASSLYHMCDHGEYQFTDYGATQLCVFPIIVLSRADAFLALQAVHLLMTFVLEPRMKNSKLIYHILIMAINVGTLLDVIPAVISISVNYLTIPIGGLIIVILALKNNKSEDVRNTRLDRRTVNAAICITFLGLTCQIALTIFDIQLIEWYWLLHSFWHTGTAWGIFLIMRSVTEARQ
jgi:hypothetical protein